MTFRDPAPRSSSIHGQTYDWNHGNASPMLLNYNSGGPVSNSYTLTTANTL